MATELPAHLKGKERWFDFDSGATVPDFMLNDRNWENNPNMQADPIWVRRTDGLEMKTCFPIHVKRWLDEGGVIIAPPQAHPPRMNDFDLAVQNHGQVVGPAMRGDPGAKVINQPKQ